MSVHVQYEQCLEMKGILIELFKTEMHVKNNVALSKLRDDDNDTRINHCCQNNVGRRREKFITPFNQK